MNRKRKEEIKSIEERAVTLCVCECVCVCVCVYVCGGDLAARVTCGNLCMGTVREKMSKNKVEEN